MAWLFGDGMGHYTAVTDIVKKWTSYAAGSNPWSVGSYGRFSRSGLRSVGGAAAPGGIITKYLIPSDATTAYMGIAFYAATSVVSTLAIPLFQLIDSLSPQNGVRINLDSTLSFVRGDAATGTVVATSVSTLSANTWYYIEFGVTINGSTGVYEVRVNGQAWIGPTSSANTQATANASWNAIAIEGPSGTGTYYHQYSDFYILDGHGSSPLNTFLGEMRGDVHLPMTPAGAHSDWTPLSGSNYTMVDETGADDGNTSYVSTSTLDAIDTYTVQDLVNTRGTIRCVQMLHAMDKAGGGTCLIKSVSRVGSTDYPDTLTHSPSAGSFMYYITPLSTNPAGWAWSETAFNAAEFGQKKVG